MLTPAPGLPPGRQAPPTQDAAWRDVMARCGPLARVLAECRLDLTIGRAAHAAGVGTPDGLRIFLRRRQLPPFRLLRDWCYLVAIAEHQQKAPGTALGKIAALRSRDPASYYRLIRRVAGVTWRELGEFGAPWARERALEEWGVVVVSGSAGQRVSGSGNHSRRRG